MEKIELVEMPVEYLIQIVVHGKLGTGELPRTMQIWARKVLTEYGYSDELDKRVDENIQQLKENIGKVFGKGALAKINLGIDKAKELLKNGLSKK